MTARALVILILCILQDRLCYRWETCTGRRTGDDQ